MAQASEGADTRNLQWRENNKGALLLSKLGWTEGSAIGGKQRRKGNNEEVVSSEGLKITKRPDGLGLGAVKQNQFNAAESTSHGSFSQLLEALKKDHPPSVGDADGRKKKKKKRKKSKDSRNSNSSSSDDDNPDDNPKKKKFKKKSAKKETVFATNKITHARVRQAKFATKSAEDMACIFGKEYSSAEIAKQTLHAKESEKKRKRAEKEKKKKQNDEDKGEDKGSGENETDKEERRRKRKEEKKKKRRLEKEKSETS